MSWSTSKEGKCCAACANWGGPRKVNGLKRAEVESINVKGKCYLGRSTVSPGPGPCYSCKSFEPWAALK